VQNDEIDHVTETRAVRKVAGNAGEQQRTRAEHTIVVSRRAHEVVEDSNRGDHRQHNEEPAAKRAAFLQLSKRDAWVLGVDELEETGNHHALVTQAKCLDGPRLRRLIGHVQRERSQQIARAPGESRAQIGCFVDARNHDPC